MRRAPTAFHVLAQVRPSRRCLAHAMAQRRPIVISGPSGAGKSTILKRLFAAHPDVFGFSISHTSRNPRAGERDGVEYHFVARDAFLAMAARGDFLEHAQFGGNCYGTSLAAVRAVAAGGRVCVLDIEMEGVKQVRRSDLNARFLFLAPPSLAELERRLKGRGTETDESLQKRLEHAEAEMAFSKEEGAHDLVVVNDDLEEAYRKVEEWIVDGGRYGQVD